jgi:hypothetical protein
VPDAIERLADACFIAQPAAFFRRKVWEEVGAGILLALPRNWTYIWRKFAKLVSIRPERIF